MMTIRPPRVSGLYAGEATEQLAAADGVEQYRPIARTGQG
jgi:hypothetical protein